MTANILLIVFVLLMAYWWSLQGFFSALIHLGIVIVCGAIAFALWHPVAFWLLEMDLAHAAKNAWGISLLMLFAIPMMIFRFTLDKLVPKNMQFMDLVNKGGGLVCGVISAMLTGGILMIGLSFMSLTPAIAGWHPYTVGSDGTVSMNDDGGKLWLPYDSMAVNLFGKLSSGAFASGKPISLYAPELSKQAGIYRLRVDTNASLVAQPSTVSVDAVYLLDSLDGLPSHVTEHLKDAPNKKLVVVDSTFSAKERGATFDSGVLYLDPSQVVLITREDEKDKDGKVFLPVAFGKLVGSDQTAENAERSFIPVDKPQLTIYSTTPTAKISMVFLVDVAEDPFLLRVRFTPFALPEATTGAEAKGKVVAALGKELAITKVEAGGGKKPSGGGNKSHAQVREDGVLLTTNLPETVSRNFAIGIIDERTGMIIKGSKTVKAPTGRISNENKVEHIYAPPHMQSVRIEMDPDNANSVLGRAVKAAANLSEINLIDSDGDNYKPIGYVLRRSNKDLEVKIDPDPFNSPVKTAGQLPMRDLRAGDKMYLYFHVRRKADQTLKGVRVGNDMHDFEPPIEVPATP